MPIHFGNISVSKSECLAKIGNSGGLCLSRLSSAGKVNALMSLKTPLYNLHISLGGRMVDFAGWEMPVQYKSIVEEHNRVRQSVGAFDISHMGRFRLYGPGAKALLSQTVTCPVDAIKPGQVKYGLVLNETGGTRDDVLVYRLNNAEGHSSNDHWALVVNASNREKIWTVLLGANRCPDTRIIDETLDTTMVAIQGPEAVAICGKIAGLDFSGLGNYHSQSILWKDHEILVSRTGYTGEDGMEWCVPAALTDSLVSALADEGVSWCGLGCRDTLRLEAAMPLYGHELEEDIDPLQSGLSFAVRRPLEGFIGANGLAKRAENLERPIRTGLKLTGKRIARQGDKVYQDGREIGVVTSGTFGPTVGASIAMALVNPVAAKSPSPVEIDVRGKREEAVWAPLPFYKRPKA